MLSGDKCYDKLPLVIAVTPEVIFDLGERHAERCDTEGDGHAGENRAVDELELQPGVAFEPIRRLLALNARDECPIVEVIMLTRRPANESLWLFRELERLGLSISAASFTTDRPASAYLKAWNADMFLSTYDDDLGAALSLGIGAAKFSGGPSSVEPSAGEDIHVVFDADGVILNADADTVFRTNGLKAFEIHERSNAHLPIAPGPFGGKLLAKLVEIRDLTRRGGGVSPVRLSIVTAREAPAHERLVRTLLRWDALPDEIHFVGHRDKAPFLAAATAHIYFDDRIDHVVAAQRVTAAGLARAVGD
jgi:5'-nucleotidase